MRPLKSIFTIFLFGNASQPARRLVDNFLQLYFRHKLTVVSESVPSQIVESFRRQAQLRVFWPPIQELQADQSDQILGAAGIIPG